MRIDVNMSLRKLEIFIAFMKYGNIARTADELELSSVSVHRALHSLEQSLHCPLFIHKGRNLVPLPSAQTLLAYACECVESIVIGCEQVRKAAGVSHPRMHIGALSSLTLNTVPHLIMGMKLCHPELELDLTIGSNSNLLDLLQQGKLDAILAAVSDNQIDPQRLAKLPLFVDDIYLASPTDTKLSDMREVELKACCHQKFVALEEGFATYHGAREAFQHAGYQPNIVMRVNDIFSLLNLVRAGIGLTLMPGHMRQVCQHSIQLIKLMPAYQMRQHIAILFDRHREQDANLRAFIAQGRKYVRDRSFNNAAGVFDLPM